MLIEQRCSDHGVVKSLPDGPAAFDLWCRAHALAPSTCDYLSRIRGSQPVRHVTSRANNVSGAYPSQKMGVTIQFESQNPELWAIVMMDHDPEVLEFFEQPDTFKLRYLDKTGKKMQGHYYTPDFLVLRKDSVCFEEWKREDDLKHLQARAPFRYQQQKDGSWRCPSAEEAVASLGLTFRVRSSAELHPIYVDNLLFLEDYFDMTLAVPVQAQTTILKLIRETPGLPLSALASDGCGIRANDVYAMLATDMIYTDLYRAPLIQHGRVHLYLNAEQAHTHAHLLPTRLTSRVGSPLPEVNAPLAVNTQLLWDGRAFTLINPGDTTTTLLPEKGTPIQIPSGFFFQLLETGVISRLPVLEDPPVSPEVDRLMDRATPDDHRQAAARFEKVMAYLNGEKEQYANIPPRTLHRWVARFREAEEQLGSGFVGLLPRKAAQGNREPKAPSAPRELMETFITEQFETPRHPLAATVYRAYEQECRKRTLARTHARSTSGSSSKRRQSRLNPGRAHGQRMLSSPGSGKSPKRPPGMAAARSRSPILIIPNWTSSSAVLQPANCWASLG